MKPADSPEPEKILIMGTGALATLFAARLAASGHGVTMLGTWANGLKILRERGARLVGPNGETLQSPVGATDNPLECLGSKYALVLVKSWQTERAARQLASCLSADGLALTLQNGLGNREVLAGALGDRRVVLGSTTTGATLLGPGLAMPGGEGIVSIEEHDGLEPLSRAIQAAGFKTEVVKDARALIWSKLIINSAINPLTALLRIPNGELLVRPSARAMLRALAEETAAVASAESVRLTSGDPAGLVENVALRTAHNHSSMFQDVQRGAPTEIDAICGAVARVGRRHHLRTPMNLACWQLVQALVPVLPPDSGLRPG